MITGGSYLIGKIIMPYIPSGTTKIISFVFFLLLGIVKLLDCLSKSFIRKHNKLNKEIRFSLFNFKFILNLYANPEDVDIDTSKSISSLEAASLAIALSFDGVLVGAGAALGAINGCFIFIFSLVINVISLLLGVYLGNKAAKKLNFDISWIGGLILILLAFSKII